MADELKTASVETMNYPVVGVTFENRQDILGEFYKTYRSGGRYGVRLVEETDNAYDPNAVAVHLETSPGTYQHVGYNSRNDNALVKEMMPRMNSARLRSIGPNRKGQIGLTIDVAYNK